VNQGAGLILPTFPDTSFPETMTAKGFLNMTRKLRRYTQEFKDEAGK
jgi:hypothetical protein